MKKTLAMTISMLLVFGLATGCGCQNKNKNKTEKKDPKEEIKVNTNENVIKDQKVDDVFEFKNTSLVYQNFNSTLETSVTNTGSNTEYLSQFKIHVKDKDGNEIVELMGYVGDSLKAGETRIINSNFGQDLSTAASIEYEVVR